MTRIAIIDGIRTPFIKAGTDFADISAQELGRLAVRELLERTAFDPELIDEVIIGNVATPFDAANIARVISILAGIPKDKTAYTVSRNCASGLEAITSAYEKIMVGSANIVVAGGAESMSNIPLIYQKETANIFADIMKAKKPLAKLLNFLRFRPRHFLNPVVGLMAGLTDVTCGLIMGNTAEVVAREYGISRKAADEFSLQSHLKVLKAAAKLREEIVPVPIPPKYKKVVEADNGVRENISLAGLEKLKPYFDRKSGTVTTGNSSQITDGACALLIMKEERAKELGYEPLGYIRSFAYAGVEPRKMGIAPAYAIPRALGKAGLKLSDIGLIEINEAFAALIIAVGQQLELNGTGKLDMEKLNVNGGAVALGHPVGATGSRLVITLLKEMKRRDLKYGLASLCIGGGQGGAIVVER
jgi:acetyl-CoA C-acetyltransferase/acetyl-CoA acyltransferase